MRVNAAAERRITPGVRLCVSVTAAAEGGDAIYMDSK